MKASRNVCKRVKSAGKSVCLPDGSTLKETSEEICIRTFAEFFLSNIECISDVLSGAWLEGEPVRMGFGKDSFYLPEREPIDRSS
jgi:hypothetical protein